MSAADRSIGSTDREVEVALFKRLPGDTAARDELVEMFLPLAEYLARRFDRRGEPLEDLVQVASVGLLNAIDRFDVERDVQFSTYAAVTIIGELKRHFRDKGWAIRVPRRLQEIGLRVNTVLPVLSQELGRSPTVEEIAARCEASPEEILDAMEAVQAYSTTSLDSRGGRGGGGTDRGARRRGSIARDPRGLGVDRARGQGAAGTRATRTVPPFLPRAHAIGDRE
jgi:RNA polymerase sigma-B factor